MKISFTKIKNLIHNVTFFWQALLIMFFVSLLIVLITSVIFWFNLDQDINPSSTTDDIPKNNALNAQNVNLILEQIKIRSAELANTMANLPNIVDPSR